MPERVIIMGAAGRDFHNFNVRFREDAGCRVVAFTATQIPRIADRLYPPVLAGPLYPDGIPVFPEQALTDLIRRHDVRRVVFSYSDVAHVEVMHRAGLVTAAGADFVLLGAAGTMLTSRKPVVAVCAVRTGCGKSQTTREVCRILSARGMRVVVVRHPMPYGDLSAQVVQRFSTYADLGRHHCTIEEREEYEPLVAQGIVVFAGVDYEKILRAAEKEADVIVWDGGNNDTPFFKPRVHLTVFDPHRAGHERLYYPGETNMRMADIAVINKVDSADPEKVAAVRRNISQYAPCADIILSQSALRVDDASVIRGKRVLVVEDGPTLTHGGMSFGAGLLAARKWHAGEIVAAGPYAVGSLREVFKNYPHVTEVLPAMGYGPGQMADLSRTIAAVPCDLVLCATPAALRPLLAIDKPVVQVSYTYRDGGKPSLARVLLRKLRHGGTGATGAE